MGGGACPTLPPTIPPMRGGGCSPIILDHPCVPPAALIPFTAQPSQHTFAAGALHLLGRLVISCILLLLLLRGWGGPHTDGSVSGRSGGSPTRMLAAMPHPAASQIPHSPFPAPPPSCLQTFPPWPSSPRRAPWPLCASSSCRDSRPASRASNGTCPRSLPSFGAQGSDNSSFYICVLKIKYMRFPLHELQASVVPSEGRGKHAGGVAGSVDRPSPQTPGTRSRPGLDQISWAPMLSCELDQSYAHFITRMLVSIPLTFKLWQEP